MQEAGSLLRMASGAEDGVLVTFSGPEPISGRGPAANTLVYGAGPGGRQISSVLGDGVLGERSLPLPCNWHQLHGRL